MGSRTRTKRRIAVLTGIALVAGACSSGGNTASPTTTSAPTSTTIDMGRQPVPGSTTGPDGRLAIRLSQGRPPTPASPIATVDGTPLSDAEVAAVVDRLPPWSPPASDSDTFSWPAQSLERPRTGATVDVPFPTREPVSPPIVGTEPLSVVRHQPDGPVPVAAFVSITFDQPMVPVGTIGDLAAAEVPATITPAIPGHWQWIGTRTLRFDADAGVADRLPMATAYRVEIPAGTASVTGATLDAPVSFEFSTPPATVTSFAPGGESLALDTVFVATFDQRVDPSAVLAATTLRADGEPRPLRLATTAEIDADARARNIAEVAPEGRWIAFRASDPLPADAAIEIDLGPGLPSAEGPSTSETAQTYTARTYAPLRVVSAGCGGPCTPDGSLPIELNNPLDLDLFDPGSVRVDPPIESMNVTAYGSTIVLSGAVRGSTTYTVTLPSTLTDIHGQTLGADDTRRIDVGPAQPALLPFTFPLTTLDPGAPTPGVTIRTVNHSRVRVRTYAVDPSDWEAFAEYASTMYGPRRRPAPDWEQIDERWVTMPAERDVVVEQTVDLTSDLRGRRAVAVVVETEETYSEDDPEYWANRTTATWVQSTRLAVDGFPDAGNLTVWVTDLASGAPAPGVEIHLGSTTATTDDDGLATVALPEVATPVLVATKGDDEAILPAGYYGDTWHRSPRADTTLWYTFDDRGTYRPGETLTVKGWVRVLAAGTDRQLAIPRRPATVGYVVHDGQYVEIASGSVDLDASGGFDLSVTIPAGANTGESWIDLTLDAPGIEDSGFGHRFRIEEYRRPAFEVTTHTGGSEPYVSSTPLTVSAAATYYAGGPLADAPVSWQVQTSEASYAPPGWDTFTFGVWTPWWRSVPYAADRALVDRAVPDIVGTDETTETFTGSTDGSGEHHLQIDFSGADGVLPDLPQSISAQATVTDVDRQAWASTTSVLVHPSTLYVGLRTARTFVRSGEDLPVEAIVTGIDGQAVAGRQATLTAARLVERYRAGEWVTEALDPQTCTITSTTEPASCTFSSLAAGRYRITATVTDDAQATSRSELTVWVAGAGAAPARTLTADALTIVPDRETYPVGETAELLVGAPFDGHGTAVVSRGAIVDTIAFEVTGGSAVVAIPIRDEWVPNLDVTIEVVGSAPRTADDGSPLPDAAPRPAYATGSITLPVSTATRTLTVEAVPRSETLTPGSSTTLDLRVGGPDGSPVGGASLAVAVADEAVLALTGYELPDPLAVFYAPIPSELYSARYGRESVTLSSPADLVGRGDMGAPPETTAAGNTAGGAAPASREAGAADSAAFSEAGAGGTIGVRQDFSPLAVFRPSVTTAADGTASVEVPLPDNLTRYRVMVVAVDGATRFGSTTASITARLPLMIRPSAPRFANFGDHFELPVVVHNQSSAPVSVDVVVQAGNLALDGPAGKRVDVPAEERVEIRFPISTIAAGDAALRVAGVGGGAADAALVELPVYTPATAEAFATYGTLDGDAAIVQPVVAPTDVVPAFGGLEVSTSSTALQALTDAVIYLDTYPYRSADGLAARIMGVAALRDVLEAFSAAGLPPAGELDAAVKRDIADLAALQGGDGGFGYWADWRRSSPYVSVQATHALVLAQLAGYTVPAGVLGAARGYLARIDDALVDYPADAADTIRAYALNVRALAGDPDPGRALALWQARGDKLPLDAIAWLWPVLDDRRAEADIARLVANRVVETAGAASFASGFSDDGAAVVLPSDRRTDALVLDALIGREPKSDLIPKIATGLLAQRTAGRWANVQENAFVLLALHRYFVTYEGQTPAFDARVWLGERFAGEHRFEGRSTDRVRISVPTATLIDTGDADLTIAEQGSGRLYYRIGLRYAPSDLRLDPLDRGFVVGRTYEAVDDPGDVSRDPDGTWRIRAGARVRVRLSMVAESQRTHAALVDPLPAGLEILNPSLAVTETVPSDVPGDVSAGGPRPIAGEPIVDWWWRPVWFDHQNLRDDRAEAFADLLPAGTYDYSYVARATTPGTFVVPPTRAEEIYAPETFGRSATDTVVITP